MTESAAAATKKPATTRKVQKEGEKTKTVTRFVIRPPPTVQFGTKSSIDTKAVAKAEEWNKLAKDRLVMKLTKETNAMHELRARHRVEEKWKAVSQEYKGWKRYYLFPLESLRDMDLFPTPNPKKGKYYKTGMYIPYGGVSWTRFFNETMVYPKQLKHLSDAEYTKYDRMVTTIVMHLIQGVSLLHQMNIVHNDIWAENLLVDSSYCVRLIDWENATFSSTVPVQPAKRSWLACPFLESCWTCAIWQGMAWKEASWCDACSENKQGRASQDWKRIARLLHTTERCYMFPKIKTLVTWLSAAPTATTAQRWIKDVVQNVAFLSAE